MKSSHCSRSLKLVDQPLVDEFQFPEPFNEHTSLKYAPISKDMLRSELLDQIRSLGQEVGGAILFRKSPGAISVLHSDLLWVDGKWEPWNVAINWNLTQAKSRMEWYDTRSEKKTKEYPIEWWEQQFDIPYFLSGMHYEGDDHKPTLDAKKFSLIESRKIQGPVLVRTDIPHRIIQMDNVVRWSLSIRLKNNHTWDEILEIFKPVLGE